MSGGLTYAESWQGYFGHGVQTTNISTAVAATVFQQITNATPKELQTQKTIVPTIQKSRHHTNVMQGQIQVAGDITGPLIPDEYFQTRMFADLLGGNNTVSGDSITGYTHTFSEASANTHYPVDGGTLEVLFGGSDSTLMSDFVGCFANSFSLGIQEGSPVECTIGYLGRSQTNSAVVGTPTYSTNGVFEHHMADLQLGSDIGSVSTVPFKSLNFSYNNNIQLVYQGNSQYPVAIRWGIPEITLEFTFDMTVSRTITDYFKNNTDIAAKIILTHPDLAGSSSGEYSVTINLPRIVALGDSDPDLTAESELTHSMNFRCIKDDSEGYAIQAEVVNSETGTYSI